MTEDEASNRKEGGDPDPRPVPEDKGKIAEKVGAQDANVGQLMPGLPKAMLERAKIFLPKRVGWSRLFAATVAVSAAITAWATCSQGRINKETLAKTAESIELTKKHFAMSERPWIGLTAVEATLGSNLLSVAGIFTNVGKAPAIKERMCAHVIVFPRPTEPLDFIEPFWQCGPTLKERDSGEFMIPNAVHRLPGNNRSSFDADDYQGFKDGRLGVYYFGWGVYSDPLGNEHELSFCVRLTPSGGTTTCRKGNNST
jgi:hypothetical protein